MKLENKHILITGGMKRLGSAIAESFLETRCRLTLHHFHSKKKINSRKADVQFTKCDLTKESNIQKMAQNIYKKSGPVDILIHNAADFYKTPLKKCKKKDWDHFINLNLRAAFLLNQFFAPKMKNGIILHICDIYATRPLPGYSPYVVAKAGLRMLTFNLASELAPRVRVCSISPGTVLPPESTTPKEREALYKNSLLGENGGPEDIVKAVHFLIENDYINGIDLKVDGGKSLT